MGDRACGKSKFDFFAALVVGHVGCWDSDHAEDFYFVAIATGKGILYARKVFWFEFVDLLNVDSKTSCSVEPSWTHITLEMLGLLVLH